MKTMKWFFLVLGAIAFSVQSSTPAAGGLFKMDFGELENLADDVDEWDVFPTFSFLDFGEEDFAVFDVTDWSGGGDDDVTLTIMEQFELADLSLSFATGMTANNPTHEMLDVEYDGIEIPYQVKDDYLYRLPDTAGTELLFRWENLDPGKYNVVLFEGRTTDGNGQFGKIWVDADITGAGEPEDENTGDFSSGGDPEGVAQIIEVEINTGQYLWYGHMEDNSGGISGIILRQTEAFGGMPALQAGDADRDLDFDQVDLVRVQVAAKYLTGSPATWGEGDWNGAPGGNADAPPVGNGLFDQVDIIAALGPGHYLMGPYAALQPDGTEGDGQTSVGYNPATGEVFVDAPAGTDLTSINIDSAGSIFTGDAAQNLGGSFDNDADNNIFKATFGSSFGSLSFGNVAATGLSQEFVLNDLTVIGSLAGGGDLGNVDLIYVPEPSAALLLMLGVLGGLSVGCCRCWSNKT